MSFLPPLMSTYKTICTIKKVSDRSLLALAYSSSSAALTPGGSCLGNVYLIIGYNFGSKGLPVFLETNRAGFLIEM